MPLVDQRELEVFDVRKKETETGIVVRGAFDLGEALEALGGERGAFERREEIPSAEGEDEQCCRASPAT